MFDIGFGELLLIGVVALVVLGPERLPKAARFAGLWVRRARNQWDSVKQELERELHAEEIKRNLQDVRSSVNQAQARVREEMDHVQAGVSTVQQHGQALRDEVNQLPDAAPTPELGAPSAQVFALDQPLPSEAAPATSTPLADTSVAPERRHD